MKWTLRFVTLSLVLVSGSLAFVACATPRLFAQAAAQLSPEVTYFVPTEARAVALTIDDGPDPVGTPPILDVLARNEAQATFFLIGSRVPGNEDLLVRMRAQFHEIANHTLRERASVLISREELAAELEETHALLSPYGVIRWFRPGSAFFTPPMLRVASRQGYRTALGDVFPFDSFIPNSGFHAWYILRHIRPGSVIILHDANGRGARTAATLEVVLPTLRDCGYQIVTLSELEALSAPQL
jgi:peptidoglycan/xylan/chitin deacetylase (PgdA/CDA1 family)